MRSRGSANARLIVSAVNGRKELLEALRWAMSDVHNLALWGAVLPAAPVLDSKCRAITDRIEAALRKAGEGA